MRIIAGEWRGRSITTLPEGDTSIRPTADRTREAVFNILVSNYGLPDEHTAVLDLCCGTGALGLEAVSRGAVHCTFIDNNAAALRLVKQTVQAFDAALNAQILLADATRLPPAASPVDLVFLDPPYASTVILPALEQMVARGWLKPGALLVIETASDAALDLPDGFVRDSVRPFGAAAVHFIRYE